MERHRDNKWYGFWKTLKEGYDAFEISRVPPKVAVCQRQYLVNASFMGQVATPDPSGECPAYRKISPDMIQPTKPSTIEAKAPSAPNPGAPNPSTRVAAYSDGSAAPAPAPAPAAMAPAQRAPQPQHQTMQPAPAASAPPPQTVTAPSVAIPVTTGPTPAPVYTPPPQAQRTTTPSPRELSPVTPAAPITRAAPVVIDQGTDPQQAVLTNVPVTSRAPLPPVQQQGATAPGGTNGSKSQQPAPTTYEEKPVMTKGVHNVVKSGKSDMIVTDKVQARPNPLPPYGSGQTSGAGQPPATGSEPN